ACRRRNTDHGDPQPGLRGTREPPHPHARRPTAVVVAVKGLLQDLNHAWRIYRRTPISSAMAVVVLAVAMAFVAAFFSLYVDLILRPHPGFEQSNRVVSVGWNNGQNASGLRYDLIERIAEESTTLDVI